MSDLTDMSLDELFAQAKKSYNGQKKQKTMAQAGRGTPKLAPEETAAQRLWSNPDNWYRSRGLVLLEQGTNKLLGNFSEYLHRTVQGGRKLIRETEPLDVADIEYVSGWVPTEVRSECPVAERSFTTRLFLQLELQSFTGAQASVTAYHYCGSITRVELRTPVSFCLPGEQLLTFPTGTNVFEMLSPAALKTLEMEIV